MHKTSSKDVLIWGMNNQLLVGCRVQNRKAGIFLIKEVKKHTLIFSSYSTQKIVEFSTEEFLRNFKKMLFIEDYDYLQDKYIEALNNIQALKEEHARRAQLAEARIRERKKTKRKKFEPIQKYLHLYRSLLDDFEDYLPNQIHIEPPALDEQDHQLISSWNEQEIHQAPYTKDKLRSARSAELAVAQYFRLDARIVEDVSLTQIDTDNSGDWQKYDLMIGNTPVDVKNARRSRTNPERYVSFCVPRFKESRNNTEVLIAAVISPWDGLSKPNKLVFLGLINLSRLVSVSKHFSSGCLSISFNEHLLGNFNLLPPWLFNYPRDLYSKQKKELAALCTIPADLLTVWEETRWNILPAYLAQNFKVPQAVTKSMSAQEQVFIKKLEGTISKLGRILPVIYLSILSDYLERSKNTGLNSFNPDMYKRILYPSLNKNDYNITAPLYVYDPLKTVDSLIYCLGILNTKKAELSKYHSYKLVGPGLLKARENDDTRWETLIAYCGGKVHSKYGYDRACGNTPLVFGDAEVCQECGKLICPKCDFCSESCSRLRQSL